MNEIVVGIDPWASGGLAWGFGNGMLATENMPGTPHELASLLKDLLSEGRVRVFLEEVGGYTGGTGAPGSAMFNFGKNYGQIIGICAALNIPVELIRPQKWQKALGLGNSAGLTKTQWKNKLKAKALQLHPEKQITLATADAVLIRHAAAKGLI